MSTAYCETLVRTQDPDRFLISIFYPEETRQHLWSLYALNHEIAKTREVVTDTHIGLIRLQWWRDALGAFYERNEVLKNEVVQGLSEAVWRYNLPREVFDHLIYAREFDLEDKQPGSLEGLCNYADFSHTPLLRLGTMVADEDPEHTSLQPVAMAYALTGLIRAFPAHIRSGRCYLPEDMTRRMGISMQAMQTQKEEQGVVQIVRQIREKAQDLLRQAQDTSQGRMIRLHKIMTEQYLNKISMLNDNPYDRRLSIPPLFREVRLWLAAQR